MASRRAASAKSVNDGAIATNSREALKDKLKQINDATFAFDKARQYKIPKTVKPKEDSDAVEKEGSVRRKVRRPSGESVIVVDNTTSASSQLRSYTTNVIPTERSSEKLAKESQPIRNSIVNSMQIKSRADLHKQMNCVADLREIEADTHEDEENPNALKRKNKSAALKAFHADQKAIHESIVNEVSRTSEPAVERNKQLSKSLPAPIGNKAKARPSPEKRRTTVEDTPESSVVTTVDDETPDTSEVMTIEDVASDVVVAVDDDFPLVGFLEKVETPSSPARQTGSGKDTEVSRGLTSKPNDLGVRKSTSEPESPKFKKQGPLEVAYGGKKSTSEPVSPRTRKALPKVLPGQSTGPSRGSRGIPKLKAKSCNEMTASHTLERAISSHDSGRPAKKERRSFESVERRQPVVRRKQEKLKVEDFVSAKVSRGKKSGDSIRRRSDKDRKRHQSSSKSHSSIDKHSSKSHSSSSKDESHSSSSKDKRKSGSSSHRSSRDKPHSSSSNSKSQSSSSKEKSSSSKDKSHTKSSRHSSSREKKELGSSKDDEKPHSSSKSLESNLKSAAAHVEADLQAHINKATAATEAAKKSSNELLGPIDESSSQEEVVPGSHPELDLYIPDLDGVEKEDGRRYSSGADGEVRSPVTIATPEECEVQNPHQEPSVWEGQVIMQDVAKFSVSAYQVSGTSDYLRVDLKTSLTLVGTISPSVCFDYLENMSKISSLEILVMRLGPRNDDDKEAYQEFFKNLNSKDRYASTPPPLE